MYVGIVNNIREIGSPVGVITAAVNNIMTKISLLFSINNFIRTILLRTKTATTIGNWKNIPINRINLNIKWK